MVLAINGPSLHVLETMRIPFAGIMQGFEMQRVTDFHSTVLCVSLMIDGGKIRFPSQCFEASRNLEFFEQLNALKITIICVIVAIKGPSIHKKHQKISAKQTYFTFSFDAVMKTV